MKLLFGGMGILLEANSQMVQKKNVLAGKNGGQIASSVVHHLLVPCQKSN